MSVTIQGFIRPVAVTVIPGGAAGDHIIDGNLPASGGLLISVRHIAAAAANNGTDRTAEFSITGRNLINNGGGTNTAGDFLVVTYALAASA